MHNIKVNFDKIIDVVKQIIGSEINELGNFKRRGTKPRFSDVSVIALSLTAECLGIDSENHLFSKLNKEYVSDFENIISRRQYNDRRKLLFEKTEHVRKLMVSRLNRQADVFAIDSMPLEICKISREQRTKWVKNLHITHLIKDTVLHRKNIFMGTNYTVFVRLQEWFNLLI